MDRVPVASGSSLHLGAGTRSSGENILIVFGMVVLMILSAVVFLTVMALGGIIAAGAYALFLEIRRWRRRRRPSEVSP
jgi:Flp pilus assembly protein TadB